MIRGDADTEDDDEVDGLTGEVLKGLTRTDTNPGELDSDSDQEPAWGPRPRQRYGRNIDNLVGTSSSDDNDPILRHISDNENSFGAVGGQEALKTIGVVVEGSSENSVSKIH